MVFGVSELQVLNSVVMNDELFIFVFESKLEQIHSREFIFRLSSLSLLQLRSQHGFLSQLTTVLCSGLSCTLCSVEILFPPISTKFSFHHCRKSGH
jgi:hypothetical protein